MCFMIPKRVYLTFASYTIKFSAFSVKLTQTVTENVVVLRKKNVIPNKIYSFIIAYKQIYI